MLNYQRVICGELPSSFKHLPGFPAHCWKRDTMVEDTHQKSTMATVDFFWRTSPPPSMQPRPMVFGPVLWDKSPTKLLSSKKNGNWTRKCVWNCQQFHRSLCLKMASKLPITTKNSKNFWFQGESPHLSRHAGRPSRFRRRLRTSETEVRG